MDNIETIESLKEESERLRVQVKKLKKQLKRSIPRKDVHSLLDYILPNLDWDECGTYEALFACNICFLNATDTVCVINLCLRLGRSDLVRFYLNYLVSKNEEIEIDSDLLNQTVNRFMRKIIGEEDVEDYIQLYRQLLLFLRKKDLLYKLEKTFHKNGEELILKFLKLHLEHELIDFLIDAFLSKSSLLKEFAALLNNYWPLAYDLISQNYITVWDALSSIAQHSAFSEKIAKVRADFALSQDQMQLKEFSSANHPTVIQQTTGKQYNWKEKSILRMFGYQITNKTEEERRAALRKARIFFPIVEIIQHIEWRLNDSLSKDGIRGDYSNSIKAYQDDLKYVWSFVGTKGA